MKVQNKPIVNEVCYKPLRILVEILHKDPKVVKGSGGCGLLFVQVLVGEEAYKRKLKMYEEENEALRRKLEKVYTCTNL